jgi:hypothetical protein
MDNKKRFNFHITYDERVDKRKAQDGEDCAYPKLAPSEKNSSYENFSKWFKAELNNKVNSRNWSYQEAKAFVKKSCLAHYSSNKDAQKAFVDLKEKSKAEDIVPQTGREKLRAKGWSDEKINDYLNDKLSGRPKAKADTARKFFEEGAIAKPVFSKEEQLRDKGWSKEKIAGYMKLRNGTEEEQKAYVQKRMEEEEPDKLPEPPESPRDERTKEEQLRDKGWSKEKIAGYFKALAE